MSAEETIRVSGATLARLKELAVSSGVTVEEALARAVERQYGAMLGEPGTKGGAVLRSDEKEWADVGAKQHKRQAKPGHGHEADALWHDEGGEG